MESEITNYQGKDGRWYRGTGIDWADPIFQQECADRQIEVDALKNRTEEEYKELIGRKGQFKSESGDWFTPCSILTPMEEPHGLPTKFQLSVGEVWENGKVRKIGEGNVPGDGFWRRLKTILKDKWGDRREEVYVAIFFTLLVALVTSILVFPIILEILVCGAVVAAMIYMSFHIARPICRFLDFWVWDTLKEVFKK